MRFQKANCTCTASGRTRSAARSTASQVRRFDACNVTIGSEGWAQNHDDPFILSAETQRRWEFYALLTAHPYSGFQQTNTNASSPLVRLGSTLLRGAGDVPPLLPHTVH